MCPLPREIFTPPWFLLLFFGVSSRCGVRRTGFFLCLLPFGFSYAAILFLVFPVLVGVT